MRVDNIADNESLENTMPPFPPPLDNGSGPEREYDPFAPRFPTLPIITLDPSPPKRSTAEKYGALFYIGVGGLVVVVALLAWFGWAAWSLRSVWKNVYVLHDAARGDVERIQAAYELGHDPHVNQRQLWDVALGKNLPPLARYVIAESLTAEAAVADPRAYGLAVSKSEGWPDWLRLLLVRPIAYAATLGFPVDKPSLIELTRNPDPYMALWAEAALAISPDRDPEHGAVVRKSSGTESPQQGLALILVKAMEATKESDRVSALDEATIWLRDHDPEAVTLWKGWKVEGGRLVPPAVDHKGP